MIVAKRVFELLFGIFDLTLKDMVTIHQIID